MGFTAVENFRAGGRLYRIGDPVPDAVAVENEAWVMADTALNRIASDGGAIVSDADSGWADVAVMARLSEVCGIEGLGPPPAGASKSQIVARLVGHWAAVGVLDLASLAGAVKPVPAPFEDPLVDPVEGAGTKPVPEIFGDPIVDAVEGATPPEVSTKLTVAQLTEIAETEGVTIGEGSTKAEIVAAIIAKRVGDNPGPRVEGLE